MYRRPAIACLLLLALATAGAAIAQDTARPSPLEVLKRFFDLTDAQVDDVKQLLEDRKAAVQPLREALAAREKAFRELLATPSPDPGAVGRLAIEMRDLRQQIGDIHKQFVANFEALLTTEQGQRLQAARRAARLEPALRALRQLGLI